MKRDPRQNPKPGDRIARVIANKAGMSGVYSRIVLAIEKRFPRGTTIVWTRKRPERPCRCTLSQWKQWARTATHVKRDPRRYKSYWRKTFRGRTVSGSKA